MSDSARDLSPFFAPRSIAVVGAGERATSSGGAIMQLLRQAGYGGRVVPVNPKGGTILRLRIGDLDRRYRSAGRPCRDRHPPRRHPRRRAANVPTVTSAISSSCPAALPKQARSAMARNAALLKLAAEPHVAIAGPNCAGIIHLDPAWRFAATFLRDLPPGAAAGASNGFAFISQSGVLAEEFIDKANARALPLMSVVSVGNAMHLGIEDYLAWLGERPEIGAALLYIELIEDHERFRPLARAVAARQAGHRPVRRPHCGRWTRRLRAYRRDRQRRCGHRGLLRLLRHHPGREPSSPPGGGQGVRPVSPRARQAGVDPLQFRRAGRDLRRLRFARRARAWRASHSHGPCPAPAAPARSLGRQPDRPFGRRAGGPLRPHFRGRHEPRRQPTTWC